MKAEDPIQPNPQDELAYRVAYLIAGYIRETLTQKEHEELDDWVTASMDNQRLFEELTDEKNLEKWLVWKDDLPTAQVLDRLRGKLVFSPDPKRSLFRSWKPYAVAASVAAILITTALLLLKNSSHRSGKSTEFLVKEDIAPGASRAILTLADGSTILLDSSQKGRLAQQGEVIISKNDSGSISYVAAGNAISPATPLFNTIATPRGGEYQLVLPDGTKVWLNAASSLRYPVFFTGNQRKVELTGEGYFEVAEDPHRPFSIQTEGVVTVVLGTHLNINTYPEEKTIQITLAEGSIRVLPTASQGRPKAEILRPGQQARLDRSGGGLKIVVANLQTTLAWKDGLFTFQDTPLEEVLRQIGRWYNVEISNKTTGPNHFNASIARDVPVSKLLHMLEQTEQIHFQIEPNRITVTN